ncbi:hypothetical protein FACS189460_0680 [Deltaproteobacteria bacterium]|nr:hypothetical protein FACS189460_0680 [Deltaproteobacteria bacterium]
MNTIIAACETIEDELKATLARLGLDYPIIWLKGGLHNSPDRLRGRLREIMAEAEGRCERLLLTLGYCGGGVSELTTGSFTTILPLADDCLSLLLGSMAARKASAQVPTYYLTAGWMRHESNVLSEYDQMVATRGQAKADRINKMMLQHYRRFGLVDTGTYDLDQAAGRVAPMAERLGLAVERLEGDVSWLERLLLGPHESADFLVVPPHSELSMEQWSGLLLGADGA